MTSTSKKGVPLKVSLNEYLGIPTASDLFAAEFKLHRHFSDHPQTPIQLDTAKIQKDTLRLFDIVAALKEEMENLSGFSVNRILSFEGLYTFLNTPDRDLRGFVFFVERQANTQPFNHSNLENLYRLRHLHPVVDSICLYLENYHRYELMYRALRQVQPRLFVEDFIVPHQDNRREFEALIEALPQRLYQNWTWRRVMEREASNKNSPLSSFATRLFGLFCTQPELNQYLIYPENTHFFEVKLPESTINDLALWEGYRIANEVGGDFWFGLLEDPDNFIANLTFYWMGIKDSPTLYKPIARYYREMYDILVLVRDAPNFDAFFRRASDIAKGSGHPEWKEGLVSFVRYFDKMLVELSLPISSHVRYINPREIQPTYYMSSKTLLNQFMTLLHVSLLSQGLETHIAFDTTIQFRFTGAEVYARGGYEVLKEDLELAVRKAIRAALPKGWSRPPIKTSFYVV